MATDTPPTDAGERRRSVVRSSPEVQFSGFYSRVNAAAERRAAASRNAIIERSDWTSDSHPTRWTRLRTRHCGLSLRKPRYWRTLLRAGASSPSRGPDYHRQINYPRCTPAASCGDPNPTLQRERRACGTKAHLREGGGGGGASREPSSVISHARGRARAPRGASRELSSVVFPMRGRARAPRGGKSRTEFRCVSHARGRARAANVRRPVLEAPNTVRFTLSLGQGDVLAGRPCERGRWPLAFF